MKIGSQAHRSSAISTSNESTIVVRGRDLTRELIGKISFTDHFWLLLAGAMPTEAQRRILDATLVAIAEHGLVPSVQVSRMTLAAAPEALQGAVAAGILGCRRKDETKNSGERRCFWLFFCGFWGKTAGTTLPHP